MRAGGKSREVCTRVLLKFGADVNCADAHGLTALMSASGSRLSADCACLLLAAGANVNSADAESRTAMMMAFIEGHSKCRRRLELCRCGWRHPADDCEQLWPR
mmetsp:Transcript_12572/g.32587  ORF Transcript_12572/g.32587 Transcript_12572/m.32587 type:complete len:103 (+) Transcript_12572:329-637(+)